MSTTNFTFFGSSRMSVVVLDELQKMGIVPTLIVTTPDKPQGRKLVLTPNIVKVWATKNATPVLTPEKLDASFIEELKKDPSDLFIVASYGKMIPNEVLEIPSKKTLNIHPSLLPRYRGASPLQSAMLDDAKETGVTVMRIDDKMDHGPIVAQEKISIAEWPAYNDFEDQMARLGARLLARILPEWVAGTLIEQPQDHSAATYTRKFTKEDGLIDLGADPYANFRKIQAFHEWPQAYFFIDPLRHPPTGGADGGEGKKVRVKITEASYMAGKLDIKKVIPEGSKEMSYEDFKRGIKDPVS